MISCDLSGMVVQFYQIIFCIIEMSSLFCFDLLYDNVYANIPGITPNWSWYFTFLNVPMFNLLTFSWICFDSILLRIFVSIFIRDIALSFSFLVSFLFGFSIRILVSQNEVGSIPIFFSEEYEILMWILLKTLSRIHQ